MNQFLQGPVALPGTTLRVSAYESGHKTVAIVGIPQGGTSMLAAVVDALGVPISDGLLNFEPETRPFYGDDNNAWTAKAKKTDAELDVWGFKDTYIWRRKTAHSCLRSPYYIMVERDAAAVMSRRAANHAVVEPHHLRSVLLKVWAEGASMRAWVEALPAESPLLLVSYERALRKRKETCEAVAGFLNLSPSAEEFDRAIARISPDGGYLRKE